jgi:PAS domain S-box-containing protein
VDSLDAIVWEMDASTWEFTFVSRQAERLLGYPLERWYTEPTFWAEVLVHPDDQLWAVPFCVQCTHRAEDHDFEYRALAADGRTVWLKDVVRVVRDAHGRTLLRGVMVDVTGRRTDELTLREQARKLDEVEQLARLGTWEWHLPSGTVTWSREGMRIHALGEEQGTQTFAEFLERVHPDDRGRVAAACERLADTGESFSVPYRIVRPDGTRELLALGKLLPDAAGRLSRVVGTSQDVTERNRAERALRDSEAALRRANEELEARVEARAAESAQRTRELEAVFQALPDLFYRLAADGTILDRRDGVGPRVDGSRAAHVLDLVPPGTRAELAAALAHAAASGGLATVEYTTEADGEPREAEARLVPMAGGELVMVVRDITERKCAEAALREREEHFRALIETSYDLVQVLDTEGRIVYTGPSVRRILGYTPEEIVSGTVPDFIHPDDMESAIGLITRVFARPGVPQSLEYRVRHKDGGWRWLETFARTLSPDSVEKGLVANARDITERKQNEEALRRAKADAEAAREEAERANRAKSDFLSRMSHELRTPMNSILGFGQVLARGELSPMHRKGVGHILTAGRHLLNLINEVLDLSRIEAGRLQMSLEPVRVSALVQEGLDLVRPLATPRGVELEPAADAADLWVRADRQRLSQVLLNLLSNAVKYNRDGGTVRVRCDRGVDAHGRERAWLRVEDTGPGIPEERRAELFVPFSRLGAEGSGVEGTGLGLALSQRLVEAMEGALELEASSAAGSVFRIGLPPASDPAAALERAPDLAGTAAGGDHGPATLLYVEDNLANLSLVETILLSRPAWITLPALQGRRGVELARERVPDLVLLDLHLPDISGEEVLRELRADPVTASIPIVVISADATERSVARLRAAGAEAYLTKPLDIDEFLATLDGLLTAG